MIDVCAQSPSTTVSPRRGTVVLGLLALAIGMTACTMELIPSTTAIADEPVSTPQVDATRPGDATYAVAATIPSPLSEPSTTLRPDEQVIVDMVESTIPTLPQLTVPCSR